MTNKIVLDRSSWIQRDKARTLRYTGLGCHKKMGQRADGVTEGGNIEI